MDRARLENLFRDHGYRDFAWLSGDDVVVGQWVRFKCQFGCPSYGKTATCPPNVPPVPECERLFRDYGSVAVLRFNEHVDPPEARKAWARGINLKLLEIERAVFVAGYPKAFLLFMDECCICDECPGSKIDCLNPRAARPSPESLAVDVFSTVKKCGFPIEVLSSYDQAMNRYAFLLVE